ncbi:MAG: SAM-dependent methyltransferase [Ferruginibacter sp.]|nr:SAM-dependent methyltransferase [Ferruginibacter sp.]
MSKRTFDDFDDFAGDYRDIHTQNVKLSGADSFYFAAMKVRLLQDTEKNQSLQVIDIGCGDGSTESFMQQYFPQWKVLGIDVSAESIHVAQQKNIANTTFEIYNGEQIASPNDSADIAFMAGVLHHVAYDLHAGLIAEIFRVLKPGGRFHLFEHNPLNPLTRYLVNTCVFDKDARLLQSGYATRLLSKAGFRIRQKRFIIFFPRKGILSRLIFLERWLQWMPFGGQYYLIAEKM